MFAIVTIIYIVTCKNDVNSFNLNIDGEIV